MSTVPVVLTIAGTDPSGGAGIQADLRVFQAAGVAGVSVITAVNAQNSLGVRGIHKVPPRFIARQIDAVVEDITVAATKIGMLGDAQIVSIVAERIRRRNLPNIVLDPVLAAKDGTPLLSPKGVTRLIAEILQQALVVTPNLPEAGILAKMEVRTLYDAREAARIIHGLGARHVLIKGGHWEDDAPPLDLLYDGSEFTELTGARIEGPAVRGTGCLYSASLAAHLALGRDVASAAAEAKKFITQAITDAVQYGKGFRVWTGTSVEV